MTQQTFWFWDSLKWAETMIMLIILASTVLSAPTIILSFMTSIGSSLILKVLLCPIIMGALTVGMTIYIYMKLRRTAGARVGTTQRQEMLSRKIAIANGALALGWFVVAIVTMLGVSTLKITEEAAVTMDSGLPTWIWIQAYLAYIISGFKVAETALMVYHRYRFERNLQLRQQLRQPPEPEDRILWETHTKWILGLIITSLVVTFLEFGLAFGDGALGGYSLWMAPSAGLLSQVVHWCTIPLWRHTAKNRRGTNKPSFVYSTILLISVGFLALLWLAASVVSFLTAASKFDNSAFTQWAAKYKNDTLLYRVRWFAAGISVLAMVLVSAQFWLIVYYHGKFFRQVANAHSHSHSHSCAHPPSHIRQSTADTTFTTKTMKSNGYDNKDYDNSRYGNNVLPELGLNTSPYSARSQLPSPTLHFPSAPQYGSERSNPQQIYSTTINSGPAMSSSPSAYSPHSPTHSMYNPVYQQPPCSP
ncbi:hypothetical protein FRC14_001589 [Serendipita sp. 396]|nr:hypothetical protein FRC14_001589 [Serendipita sp. 396]KAG8774034.1 hypothetical protein FRC15_001611 [Serendipita sp. 397]KAG8788400.1 hypothetical protein FRC16_001408 [Serendipita sp. 398]KAG8818431.1 hypothetical protein FRC19_010655 [Serendipita sp. 401]KAG8825904.1 hypothetical protein FRC18_010187 [Serendipita sp. 400]KAG8852186.1 hypothetical protein FRC20_001584 [Serendipita sp. 405]